MANANRDRIGARIAAMRKTRGWTARELARRARVSYSLLAKAESGAVPASPALIGAVARALAVDVTRLTGQPYDEPGNGTARLGLIEPLRRSLLAYDLPPPADVRPRPAGELRALTLDRIEWAARRCGDPLRVARTEWSRGASLLSAGAYDQGLSLMERTRRGLEAGPMDEAARSVYGSLHLRSAVLAARAGRRPESDAHLAEARDLARTVPAAANHYGMEFGPANVALHEVSAAVELADGTLAVTRAAEVERSGLLASLPAVRVGHYYIEVARGWLYHGDRHQALNALRRARRAAPQQARYHPMV